jgi:HEAT repeat protein
MELGPLRRVLTDSNEDSDPKTVLSAHAALSLLNDPAAREFDGSALFATLWKRDTARSHQIAVRWSGKWQVAAPYFRQRLGILEVDDAVPAA